VTTATAAAVVGVAASAVAEDWLGVEGDLAAWVVLRVDVQMAGHANIGSLILKKQKCQITYPPKTNLTDYQHFNFNNYENISHI
jgi:hypothetical protein